MKTLLKEDVILPQKETIEVYNVGTAESPRYIVTEKSAREALATHSECSTCGHTYRKSSYCENCSDKRAVERYQNKPFKEWDGETPLCIYNTDQYFFSEEDLQDYIEDNGEPTELVICSPNYLRPIEEDYWEDIIPENYGSLSEDFTKKLKEFNNYIEDLEPISWSEGIYRTEYKK